MYSRHAGSVAGHVVCPIDKFPPMAFLRFNKQSQQYKEIIRKPKTPL